MSNPLLDKVVLSECVLGMQGLPSEFIHLTVTSPPYDSIRTYGGRRGWEFDFRAVAEELYRITVPGGVVAWVVQERIINGSESGESSRQRLGFENIGFRIHHTMVARRKGGEGYSHGRYGRPLEYMMIFSKGKPRYFNPLRDRPNTVDVGRVKRKTNRNPNGSYDRASLYKVAPYGIRGNVWEYATGFNSTTKDGYAFEHDALMPEKMAEDLILSWSKIGDVIFDPFSGACTTQKMAVLNGRHYLGFERVPKYYRICQRRLREAIEAAA